jgi:isoleucyl-tRNA synthetase
LLDGAPFLLTKDDVISTVIGRGGLFAASGENVVVAVDAAITPELRAEWYVREVEHFVQGLRKDKGFEVTDRIRLTVLCSDQSVYSALEQSRSAIAGEVLADVSDVSITYAEGDALMESDSASEGVKDVLDLDGSQVRCTIETAPRAQ